MTVRSILIGVTMSAAALSSCVSSRSSRSLASFDSLVSYRDDLKQLSDTYYAHSSALSEAAIDTFFLIRQQKDNADPFLYYADMYDKYLDATDSLPDCFAAEWMMVHNYMSAIDHASSAKLFIILADISYDYECKNMVYSGGWKKCGLVRVNVNAVTTRGANTTKFIEYIPKILEFVDHPNVNRTSQPTSLQLGLTPGRYWVWPVGQSSGKRQLMTVTNVDHSWVVVSNP